MSDINQALQLLSVNKRLFIALDRDGTLVSYSDRPEEAVMTESMRNIINDLAALPEVSVAVISARDIARLKTDSLSREVILAGNYGMEILFADGQLDIHPLARRVAPLLKQAYIQLIQLTENIKGLILENATYSLCLHWHMVPEEKREGLHKSLKQFQTQLDPELYMRTLPTSYEFLPNMDWDKSHALQEITGRLKLSADNCLNLYIGDTQSDEPAFIWANKYRGVSIKVGSNVKTNAQHMLPGPENVAHFLQQLKLQKENCA